MNIELRHTPEVESHLLNLIQADFPLSERPFAALAQRLGTTEDDVIRYLRGLKEIGVLREIGPVISPQALGYRSTLVAMKMSPGDIEEARQRIRSHPGISHAYVRENEFNLWVTLTTAGALDADSEVADLAKACGAHTAISLPAIKTYKLKAMFGCRDEEGTSPCVAVTGSRLPLGESERRVVNAIQEDLPLVPTPFESMARSAGAGSVAELLTVMESLRRSGVIRRYGASINHRRAGYAANSMVCWRVPEHQADSMGQALASLRSVSHCYLREVHPLWPYNIYAMMHAGDRESCLSMAANVSAAQGAPAFIPLFSTFEIKKQRNRYSA